MRKYKHLLVAFMVLLVPIVVWVGMGATPFGWQDKSDLAITNDILLGTTGAASTLDSTACFAWCPSFTINIGPGYNDTSYFALGRAATGYQDSIMKRLYLRGWTSPDRKRMISLTPLWSYAAPFTGTTAGYRPKSNLWAAISSGSGAADSCTRYILADRSDFFLSGAVSTYDSTSYYYGDGRAKNYIHVPFAPYYDIVASDSAAACGKGLRIAVTVVGFPAK